MNATVNILHISDFHFSKSSAHDQKVVIDAMLHDINQLSSAELKPDFVVFSGDLVNNADEERVYDFAFDGLIEPVLKAARCAESRVLIAPGNHDAHRSVVEGDPALHKSLWSDILGRDAANSSYASGQFGSVAKEKFSSFSDLRDYLCNDGVVFDDSVIRVRLFEEFSIAAIEINTAVTTLTGLYSTRDERHLVLPEASLLLALQSVPSGYTSVFVSHHPTNWLSEECETDYLQIADGRANLSFFGHMHEPRPSHAASFRGSTFHSQAGGRNFHFVRAR